MVEPLQRMWSHTFYRAPSNDILHCSTNDSKASSDPEQIAENLIDTAKFMKTDKNKVITFYLPLQMTNLTRKPKKLMTFLRENLTKATLRYKT